MPDDFSVLSQPACVVAPRLLGCILERRLNGKVIRAKIVETEAYDESDEASHSFRPKTKKTSIMFGPPGFLYVYFTYGKHYCANVVVGKDNEGAAVLIRAVEPLNYEEVLSLNRQGSSGVSLTNGPAKLCQALMIDAKLYGHDLTKLPLKLLIRPKLAKSKITQTSRIGITKAISTPWRFYVTDSPYVSKLS